ncbi:MAG: TonB-dependent receptor [Dysgonamonadaceae bacterium]|jgi:TonB-linked SusC/RagA family outer membrane protein|nr:TonB-dependent receptor [Dysgonamonadaceae bacterium]
MKKILFFFTLCLFLSGMVSAQTNLIKGIVLSSVDEEPLIGVSILVKGTTDGAVTDLDGAFSLNVRPSDVLVISYVGYISREVAVGSNRDFRILLNENRQELDEVVVIGYGVQKKSLVSGAIGKVTSTDIEKTMPTRLEDVLNGKVAGLTVMQNSGQPGSDSGVFIRGIGTVNNSGPLYVVDGMQIEGSISFLNPKDITSVEVLKDAASAAIYGTRGANGVIIITTRQGVKGKGVINYEFSYGWQNPWKKKEVLNAQEYMTLMNEMQVNDGGMIRFSANEIANAGTTDWQDEVFNYNAPIVNHNLSMTGGSETNTYAFSFGYLKQDGIVGGNYGKSNLERYNFRINDSQTAFQTNTRSFLNKLRAGVNMGYTHGNNTTVDTNSEFGSILGSALVFAPYLPVYADDPEATLALYPNAVKDKDGRVFTIPLASDKYQEIGNPVAMLNNTAQYQINEEDVFVGGVWAELDIWKGIKFRSSYSIDMSFWGNNGYNMPYYIAPQGKHIDDLEHSNIYGQKNKRFTWQTENYLSWTEKFADKHNIELVLGQSALKTTQSQIGGSRGMPLYNEHDLLLTMNNTPADKTYYDVYGYYNGGSVNFYALASYFGRFNYNFDERYILSASVRRDGSSRFGPDKKWGVFPAVSVAWNILNEPYISNVPWWLNAAKLRGSWGRNGNDRIGDLRYMTTYARGGAYDYYFGGGFDPSSNSWVGSLVSGLQPGAIENRLLAWEQSEQTNIGFDLYMLRSAFNFSFDWFKKSTIGMLQTTIIAPSTGQGAPIGNVGTMSNRGAEINAGYKGHAGKFNFFVDANATYVKTILDKYANATGIQTNIENQGNTGVGEYMRGETGEVYPFFYGLKTNGLFQNWNEINSYTYTSVDEETGTETVRLIQPNARPGDIRFVDTNDDGQITSADKVKIGKPMPDWQLGITLGGDWNGFDFNLFFKSALGFQIFDYAQRGDVTALNRPAWILQRWHGEGTSTTIPRMTAQNPNGNYNSSDLYMKDGSYLRLKTAQIGYTLSPRLTQKVAIQKFRVYVAAYNLLTFTGYDGFDIEMGSHSVDRGIYPQSRTIAVGANITF